MSDEINEVEKKDFVNQLENHKGEDVIDINIGNLYHQELWLSENLAQQMAV